MQTASIESTADPSPRVGIVAFIVMMSGLTATNTLFCVLPPLMPPMARSFGPQGAFLTQMIFATASLGLMLTALLSGLVVRAIGVRPMVIFAALLFGLAGSVPSLTENIPILLLSRLLTGGACGLLTTGSTIALAQSYSGTARSRVLGYQTSISSASGLIGLAISGSIVASHGWHAPFLTYAVFGLSLALLAIIGMPAVKLPQAAPGKGFLRAFTSIWPVCAAGILLMMPPLLVTSNAPFILVGLGATSPLLQSIVVSMSTGFAAVSGSVFGRIQGRLGVRRTFAGAVLCAAAGALLLGTGTNFWMIACGCALTGFGTGLFLPHLWMLSTTLVPESIQGHAIGLLSTSMFLGGFVYPLLVGGLEQAFGLRGAMVAIGILLALGAAGVLIARETRLAGAERKKAVLF